MGLQAVLGLLFFRAAPFFPSYIRVPLPALISSFGFHRSFRYHANFRSPCSIEVSFSQWKEKTCRQLHSSQSAIQKNFTVHIQRELVDLTDVSRKTEGDLASVKNLSMIAFNALISLPV